MIHIRDFTPDDYAALAAVRNAIYPDRPLIADTIKFWDERRLPEHRHARWVAEIDGRSVGYADYGQSSWDNDDQTFTLGLFVHPDAAGQGVGAALYDTLMAALLPLDPNVLRAIGRSDCPRGLAFAVQCGFSEDHRHAESRLDVRAFDFTPYAGLEERLRGEGITIRTLADLAGDPQRDAKLYALDCETSEDLPDADSFTMPEFAQWKLDVIDRPDVLAEAHFVAVAPDGGYVGFTSLLKNLATRDLLHTGYTAVQRDYRRRGIALAVKLRAIRFAQEYGCHFIETGNEVHNAPMLAINNRLGFVPGPEWVFFKRQLNGG